MPWLPRFAIKGGMHLHIPILEPKGPIAASLVRRYRTLRGRTVNPAASACCSLQRRRRRSPVRSVSRSS